VMMMIFFAFGFIYTSRMMNLSRFLMEIIDHSIAILSIISLYGCHDFPAMIPKAGMQRVDYLSAVPGIYPA